MTVTLENAGAVAGIAGTAVTILSALIGGTIKGLKRNDARLTVTYNFTTSDEFGDTIVLTNIGDKPALIEHWELVWRRRDSMVLREEPEAIGELGADVWRIDPHTSRSLTFMDGDRLRWGARHARLGRMYLKIFRPGHRRPQILFVHDPRR